MKKIKHRTNQVSDVPRFAKDGFCSVELDVRSYNGALYASHDRIIEPNKDLRFFWDVLGEVIDNEPEFIIVNVKEANLEEYILEKTEEFFGKAEANKIKFLDSQIPDIVRISKLPRNSEMNRNPFILRMSEYEYLTGTFLNLVKPGFIWIDFDFVKCCEDEEYFKDFEMNYSDLLDEFIEINHSCSFNPLPILVNPLLYPAVRESGNKTKVLNSFNKLTNEWLFRNFYVCQKEEEI